MFELGASALEERTEVANAAWQIKGAEVFLAGSDFARVCRSTGRRSYQDVDEVILELKSRSLEGGTFLIKGSRGMKMERVLEAFTPS